MKESNLTATLQPLMEASGGIDAVIAPLFFWGVRTMPGYVFPAVRKIACSSGKPMNVPVLVTLSDDAHAVREGLIAATETVPIEVEYHAQREALISRAEKEVYIHSDIGQPHLEYRGTNHPDPGVPNRDLNSPAVHSHLETECAMPCHGSGLYDRERQTGEPDSLRVRRTREDVPVEGPYPAAHARGTEFALPSSMGTKDRCALPWRWPRGDQLLGHGMAVGEGVARREGTSA
eukprot:scaffold6638_cov374-Prasinococcus_capsulatus_cf.AAC.5